MNPYQAWKAKLEGALFLGVHNCKKIVCFVLAQIEFEHPVESRQTFSKIQQKSPRRSPREIFHISIGKFVYFIIRLQGYEITI